jgi:hypothetical protein
MAVARFAGLRHKSRSYLGFRASALHPRLYSDAHYRGLRRNTRALCQSLGNDE